MPIGKAFPPLASGTKEPRFTCYVEDLRVRTGHKSDLVPQIWRREGEPGVHSRGDSRLYYDLKIGTVPVFGFACYTVQP